MLLSQEVLDAFGAIGDPIVLPGGQGTTVRVGNVILKPGTHEVGISWVSETINSLEVKQSGFRVPKHIRAKNGSWIVDGWFAQEYLEGKEEKGRWAEKFEACKAFHRALVGIPRPDFLDTTRDPWAIADRMVWGEIPLDAEVEVMPVVRRLADLLQPVGALNQVIHGDFGGNVLFSPAGSPIVIDFSPYFRPAAFALAIVAVDALVWGGADSSVLDILRDVPELDQMLLRAEMRRLLEISERYRQGMANNLNDVEAYARAVDLLCARSGRT